MSVLLESNTDYKYLGKGIYGLREVSDLTGLHYNTVHSWFSPSKPNRKRKVFVSDHPRVDNHYAVSFLDLIDVFVASRFRGLGVSLKVIREVYSKLQQEFGMTHPFCHELLSTDGRKIFIDLANDVDDRQYAEVVNGQGWFAEGVQPYLKQIDYGPSSNIAERWRIFDGVVIDPLIGFGKPIIEKTGTSTEVLARAYHANEDNVSVVSSLYGLAESEILTAVKFEDDFVGHTA